MQVVVTNGTITKVTSGVAPAPRDQRHGLAIPGIASLHSHAFQRGMAGLAETRGDFADTFWTWRETMYRFALEMTPEDNEAVATLLYVEMLERGFTRVGEFHYLHHDRDGTPYADPAEMAIRIVRAADIAGIGLTLLPSFYAPSTFGGAVPHPAQRRFICSVDQFARLMAATRSAVRVLPGANVGIAPHSLRAVTPDELAAIAPLHNAINLEGIRAAQKSWPRVPQVAVFDTAFHATIPVAAHTYALPQQWRRRWDLRRFGFHGLSHSYASRRAAEMVGRPLRAWSLGLMGRCTERPCVVIPDARALMVVVWFTG